GQESVDAASKREIRFPDGAASDAGMPGNRRDSGQHAGTHRSDQRSPRHPQVPLSLQVQWLRSSRRSRLFDGGHGRHVGHQRWWFAGQDLERSAARNPQGCRACGLSRRLHPRGLPVQLRRRALQEIAMPKKSWTPEERKAFGDKMKARRDAVKQASEVKKTYTEFGTAGPEVKEKVIHEVGVAMPRDEPTPEMQTPDPRLSRLISFLASPSGSNTSASAKATAVAGSTTVRAGPTSAWRSSPDGPLSSAPKSLS